MAAVNDSQFCWESYLETKSYVLTALRISLSFIGCLFTLAMLVIIILLERYKFFTQRLSLYLAISGLCASLTSTFDFTPNLSYINQSALSYCQFIAFFEITTLWWFNLATAAIMIVVFIEVVPKRPTDKMEPVFVLVIFGLPLTFTWIPYITSHYGPVEYVCWIQPIDFNNNCTGDPTGALLNLVIYYAPTYLIMIVISILLLIAFVSLKRRKRVARVGHQRRDSRSIQKKLLSEIRPLMLYPLIVIILNVFGLLTLIGAVYSTGRTSQFIFNLLFAIGFRLQWVVITLVYTFEPDTRKRLRKRELRMRFQRCLVLCVKEEQEIVEYTMGMGRTDSRREPKTIYKEAISLDL